MPFYDFGSETTLQNLSSYDFCIVGAGAAGILLACRLSERKKRVLLVESGHFFEDEDRQALNSIISTGKPLNSAGWGRKRAIGGTTIAWGGQSLPFDDIDFEVRQWVQNSGWPIRKKDLNRFYDSANSFMGIDTLDFDDDVLDLFKLNKLAFGDNKVIRHFSKWAPEPNFRIRHEKALKENVDVLYNAQLTKISLLNDERLSIELCSFNHRKKELIIPKLILATGGIETIRILLLNDHQFKNGIGNHSGWLGKCFMEHPCMTAATVKNIPDPYKFQKQFNTHINNKIRYSTKLSLSSKAQKREKLLNASVGLLFEYPDGDINPYTELKSFFKSKDVRKLFTVIPKAASVGKSAFALFYSNFYYKHQAVPKLGIALEQEPLKNSCIRLGQQVDYFGLRKAQINWEVSELTWRTAVLFMEHLRTEMERLNLGEVTFSDDLALNNPKWLSCLSDVNHHMGGTRMSGYSYKGVVDSNCEIWGVPNLYISSASVFPTSSHSNPTLTILALAERLVEHLCE